MEADIQVVMVNRFAEKFDAWLRTQNLCLAGPIPGPEDDLPTYVIGITWAAAMTPTGERVR